MENSTLIDAVYLQNVIYGLKDAYQDLTVDESERGSIKPEGKIALLWIYLYNR